MALPPAGRKIHFFSILNQKVYVLICFAKSRKKTIKNKSTNFKKSVLQTVFCEKRQTGNVLLIDNIVIRNFFTGTRPEKSPFY